jgi:PBS lyase HEAT-like repeat
MSFVSSLLTPLGCVWGWLVALLRALDRGLVWFAAPFGVNIKDPRKRYPVLLGVFVVIYFIGLLPVQGVPLVALALGYVGVLAIGRAWVVNEKQRAAISKKLINGNPDEMPDLRWTALVSALQLLFLFPLLFQQVQWHYHLFAVKGQPTLGDWFWFTLDKTYLKALPDWSILYGVHISAIDFAAPWGRHLVLGSRLTFDYILIQGILRLLAIRATIREAVAVVKTDPDMAVRLGKRAMEPLIAKLHDPDKVVRGAAANALMQLGDARAVEPLIKALKK